MKGNPLRLTASEYQASNRHGMNPQIVNARWHFLVAVKRHVPEFFEQLREQVYPAFAKVVKPGYWRVGDHFARWQSRSDQDRVLTPVLLKWARKFHVEEETWILEGALQTLSSWHKFPHTREKLEIIGFRKPVAVSGLIMPKEQIFRFEDEGWDPTFMSFRRWHLNARQRFEQAVSEHKARMKALVEKRGGTPTKRSVSPEHFDWLALYQCGGVTLEAIVRRARYGDKTTVSKGLHAAAALAGMRVRAKGAS